MQGRVWFVKGIFLSGGVAMGGTAGLPSSENHELIALLGKLAVAHNLSIQIQRTIWDMVPSFAVAVRALDLPPCMAKLQCAMPRNPSQPPDFSANRYPWSGLKPNHGGRLCLLEPASSAAIHN